jgi:hypothetical protein
MITEKEQLQQLKAEIDGKINQIEHLDKLKHKRDELCQSLKNIATDVVDIESLEIIESLVGDIKQTNVEISLLEKSDDSTMAFYSTAVKRHLFDRGDYSHDFLIKLNKNPEKIKQFLLVNFPEYISNIIINNYTEHQFSYCQLKELPLTFDGKYDLSFVLLMDNDLRKRVDYDNYFESIKHNKKIIPLRITTYNDDTDREMLAKSILAFMEKHL